MIFHTRDITSDGVVLVCNFSSFTVKKDFGATLPAFVGAWTPQFAVHAPKCIFLMLTDGVSQAVWVLDHDLNLLMHDIASADPESLKNVFMGDLPLAGQADADSVDVDILKDLIGLGDLIGFHGSCFVPGYQHKFIAAGAQPGTERQAAILPMVQRVRDTAAASGEGCFPQTISYAQYEKGAIEVDDEQGDAVAWRTFVMLGNFGYLGYNDSPKWSGLVLVVSGHVKHIVGVLDMVEGVMYEFTPTSHHILPRALTWSRLLQGGLIQRMKDPVTGARAHCFRENHIGHYIWNELSTVGVCLKPGRDLSVFVHVLCDEPLYPVDEVFEEVKTSVHRGITDFDLVKAALIDKFNFFPFSTFKVTTNFRERVLRIAEKKSEAFDAELAALKAQGRTIVLIGLRLENRMWPGQFEGYKAFVKRLWAEGGKYHIIFDGHNYLRDNARAFMNSHMETLLPGGKTIVDVEMEKIDEFNAWYQAEVKATKKKQPFWKKEEPAVTVKSLVPCSVGDSIIAALRSDYFLTHWGAGLAKYKWLTNARGGVFSSYNIMTYKGDIRIYDTEPYLQDAIELDFLPAEKARDSAGEDASLLKFEGPERGNFSIDPEVFADWAVGLIKLRCH